MNYELTDLQYAEPVKGDSYKLYIFDQDGGTKHGGPQWFTSGRIRYPDEQITAEMAKGLVDYHMEHGHEIRICDGGDFLVFHAIEGKQVYPKPTIDFWGKL